MSFPAHPLCRLAVALLLILVTANQVSEAAMQETVASAEDPTIKSRNAFDRLAEVYRSGGSAPDLDVKLNAALELIDEAQLKRASGDESQAILLGERARAVITEIVNELPAIGPQRD